MALRGARAVGVGSGQWAVGSSSEQWGGTGGPELECCGRRTGDVNVDHGRSRSGTVLGARAVLMQCSLGWPAGQRQEPRLRGDIMTRLAWSARCATPPARSAPLRRAPAGARKQGGRMAGWQAAVPAEASIAYCESAPAPGAPVDASPAMRLLGLPSEIHLLVADNLEEPDLNAWIQAATHFAHLLAPLLYRRAAQNPASEAVHWAAERGPVSTLRLLADAGANIKAPQTRDGSTPLLLAAQHGRLDAVRLLLARGAEPATANQNNTDALGEAVAGGHEDVVNLLLQAGCDVNRQDDCVSDSALQTAVARKEESIVGLLLEHGADPNAWCHGNAPIFEAIRVSDVRILRLLFRYGVDVNVRDIWGRTPLINAVDKPKILQVLLEVDEIDIHALVSGQSALHAAISSIESTKLLLDRGVNVNFADGDGYTALHYAAMRGYHEIAQLLLANGAAIDALSHKLRTPLHLATGSGYATEHLVSLLLDHGADVNARDLYNLSPLDMVQDGNHRLIQALVARGAWFRPAVAGYT